MTTFIDRILDNFKPSNKNAETPAWEQDNDLPHPTEVEDGRSNKSVETDDILQAEVIDHTDPAEYRAWVDQPNEFDILEVDSHHNPVELTSVTGIGSATANELADLRVTDMDDLRVALEHEHEGVMEILPGRFRDDIINEVVEGDAAD